MCQGFWDDQTRLQRLDDVRARWQTFYPVYVQLDKRSRARMKTPRDLFRFEWERDRVKYTYKDWERAKELLGERWEN